MISDYDNFPDLTPAILYIIFMAGIHVPGYIGSVAYYDACPSVWMTIRVLTACDTLLMMACVSHAICMIVSTSSMTPHHIYMYLWIVINMTVKAIFVPVGLWQLFTWECQGLPMWLLAFYTIFTSSLLILVTLVLVGYGTPKLMAKNAENADNAETNDDDNKEN
jgi:hypothetical protein